MRQSHLNKINKRRIVALTCKRRVAVRIFDTRSADPRGQSLPVLNPRITGSPLIGNGVQWLVSDYLGTPRMVIDKTGKPENIKRHDYLPFGEEILAGSGARTAASRYASGDGVRQQFTLKERDFEIGLDYFLARHYSSTQGRLLRLTSLQADLTSYIPSDCKCYETLG